MKPFNRFACLPSRMTLITFKTRLKGAQKGHSLLKKKSDALVMRFRGILKVLKESKEKMDTEIKEVCEKRHTLTHFRKIPTYYPPLSKKD